MASTPLDAVFNPRTVVIVGASGRPGALAEIVLRNLTTAGFPGRILLVGPHHRRLAGQPCYPDVARLPTAPDLGLICTPPAAVPGIIDALGRRGARAAVVISAGFAEVADGGVALQRRAQAAAARHNLRLLGPNCLGVIVPGSKLNASVAQRMPAPGRLAFAAQSGAMVTAAIDWASARGIGFSHLVSLGDMADVGFGDVLDHWAGDAATRGILLYMEAIRDARRFLSAARAAARMKPIIVVKAGRHAAGARAVAAHTGVLAGTDAVYDAAFRRAGVLRVSGLTALFDAAEILALARPPRGDRLLILSNSGALAVLATDELLRRGGQLAALPEAAMSALDAALAAGWSRANPVDIGDDADGERYAAALRTLTRLPDLDAVLVLYCPSVLAQATADAVANAVIAAPRGPQLLTSWVGAHAVADARRSFAAQRIPTYDTPEQAVRAFMGLVRHREAQRLLMETPPSPPEGFTTDAARVQTLLNGLDADALARRGGWLTEVESMQVLAAYGIPTVPTRLAETPAAAAAVAADLGAGPWVVKPIAPPVPPAQAAGAVALDLTSTADVERAAALMARRLAAGGREAEVIGFSVQPMVRRRGAHALMVGVAEDVQFGPVLVVGHGGGAAEAIDDKAVGLPPLNLRLARDLIARTRIHRVLRGAGDAPAADLDAVALVLMRVSQLVCDFAELRALDINPLLTDADGVIALDARMRVDLAAHSDDPGERLAIRPYPKALEEPMTLGDGRRLLLRPIRPEDEPGLKAAVAGLTPEESRLRFFAPTRTLDHVAAARFTQLDYDREMALVLTTPGVAGRTPIYAVANLSASVDRQHAEYAVLVRHDMAGMGLGVLLMRRIIDYARSRGVGEITGDVLADNRTMLKLCEVFGFSSHRDPEDVGIVKVRLRLDD
ncbi:bifunctional acetate--CoA ligase family protein/GNAT family N-acetyltransferase [uncultured Thiohalocapsa sp.]|uniref:bifunctional acetate--CoA ligase family protein/GNAT family N-acetyltransferase n=1 Tax=uncultured Thiohalocapsa sp. TaxID=768990 RepID=UPI0025E6DAA1|nr:bifunctional acetate--CoA ligase family protein/GNAT family N-acetyltransferase [uncultured Thiohalocapsa sp.]